MKTRVVLTLLFVAALGAGVWLVITGVINRLRFLS